MRTPPGTRTPGSRRLLLWPTDESDTVMRIWPFKRKRKNIPKVSLVTSVQSLTVLFLLAAGLLSVVATVDWPALDKHEYLRDAMVGGGVLGFLVSVVIVFALSLRTNLWQQVLLVVIGTAASLPVTAGVVTQIPGEQFLAIGLLVLAGMVVMQAMSRRRSDFVDDPFRADMRVENGPIGPTDSSQSAGQTPAENGGATPSGG